MHIEEESKKSVKTIASNISVRHNGWSTQAAWTNNQHYAKFSV